jgi:hypothetical protein
VGAFVGRPEGHATVRMMDRTSIEGVRRHREYEWEWRRQCRKGTAFGNLRDIQSALRAHSPSVLVKDAACDTIEFILSCECNANADESVRLGILADIQTVMRVHLYHEDVHILACFALGLSDKTLSGML